MTTDTIDVTADDGTKLFTRRWLPEGSPRAIVQIAHGMAEHSERYDRLAQALTDAGFAVYANDHRGHGHTAAPADHGYFADQDGYAKVVGDLDSVRVAALAEHPGLPVVLLGHSMGSFLARSYATQHGDKLAALVLSGTGGDPGLLGKVGLAIAKGEAKVRGRRHKSGLMNALTFGQYNAKFKPKRTDFDWLSRDPSEVDKYIADPLSGNVFTSGFFVDLLGGLAQVNDDGQVSKVPNQLPILLVSGDLDPVGAQGKGVRAVAAQYERLGVREVTTKLYPGARHEIFNETNRDEITADVIGWINDKLAVS